MKFLVGRNRREAVATATKYLLWERVKRFELRDLYHEEIMVISKPEHMRGYRVTCVYLLPSFADMQYPQRESFQRAFALGNIKTQRIVL